MYLLYSVFIDCRVDIPVLNVGLGGHHSQVGVEESRALASWFLNVVRTGHACVVHRNIGDNGKRIDSISFRPQSIEGSTAINLDPRFPLSGGWGGLCLAATRFPLLIFSLAPGPIDIKRLKQPLKSFMFNARTRTVQGDTGSISVPKFLYPKTEQLWNPGRP